MRLVREATFVGEIRSCEMPEEYLAWEKAYCAEIKRMVKLVDECFYRKAREKGRGRLLHLCKYAKTGRARMRNGKRAVRGMHLARLADKTTLVYRDDDGEEEVIL